MINQHLGFCVKCSQHEELDQDGLCWVCYDLKCDREDNGRQVDNHAHVYRHRQRKERRPDSEPAR